MTEPEAIESPETTDGPDVVLTGHAEIDDALGRLERLADLPVTEHPQEFDAIHGVLREVLAGGGREDVTGHQ